MSESVVSREAGSSLGRVTDTVELAQWRGHQEAMSARLEQIAEVERQIATLQADQLQLTASFLTDRLAFDQAHGFASDQAQYRGMVAEVAIAKRVSVITAGSFLNDAWSLTTRHPHTMAALRAGRISLPAARAVTHETCVLDDNALLALADQVIAADAQDVLPGKVRALAETRVAQIDPDAAIRRRVREHADQHLQLHPAGSGMAWLNAYLPAEHAVAAYNAVHEHARSRYAAGDRNDATSTVSQLMCDTLVQRLTGTTTDAIPAHVNVIMTDTTLLGLGNDPAHLIGAGPLDAATARTLATSSTAWLRRFLTDPVDGSLTHGDSRRRRFDGTLRDLIIARDQHCRGIQCASPIRDIDHINPHACGGPTTQANGQGVSGNCHTTREDPRMHVHQDPTTTVITWTTPSGLTYNTLPPPAHTPGLTRRQRNLRKQLLHPPPSTLEQHLTRELITHLRTTRRRC
ncbi:MAG: DUF222 domain-containing protein [Nocardioidaceae bacterium]